MKTAFVFSFHGFFDKLNIRSVDKTKGKTVFLIDLMKKADGAAVKIRRSDDMVTRLNSSINDVIAAIPT